MNRKNLAIILTLKSNLASRNFQLTFYFHQSRKYMIRTGHENLENYENSNKIRFVTSIHPKSRTQAGLTVSIDKIIYKKLNEY